MNKLEIKKSFPLYLELLMYFCALALALGRFLPVFYAPELLRSFFSWGTGLYFLGFGFLVTGFMVGCLRALNIKKGVIIFTIYIILFFLIPPLQNVANHLVITLNRGKSQEQLVNPFLGMQLIKKNERKNLPFDVIFVFDKDLADLVTLIGHILRDGESLSTLFDKKSFSGFNSLVYDPNHNLMEQKVNNDLDASYKEIYDNDWYYYSNKQ